ncbi:MAG: ABC transporter ATP-binding protein [Pseudohongiella sp.]|nr:ABC transporter ATP-binding protein [Pseudohongiella sp.]
MTASISIRNLSYSPPIKRTGSGSVTSRILYIPEWDVQPGERVFLYGPSGSGKTSLLNLVCGIANADSGQIIVNGTDLCTLSARAKDRFRMQTTGVIFQQFNLLPYLSVNDNIKLGYAFSGAGSTTAVPVDTLVKQLMDRLKLPRTCLHQKAACLSFGQQQRVAIARALIKSPPLIVADEPTSALDAETRDDFISTLLECSASSNSTVLFVSHEHSLGAHFDRLVDLRSINKMSHSVHGGNSHVC